MRYRYSLWDPVVAMLTLLQLYGAWWVMQNAGPEIPLHWGPTGAPDRFGPPGLGTLLPPMVFALVFYVAFRLLDGWLLSRKPDAYGFLTYFAGGFALLMAVLEGVEISSIASPNRVFTPLPFFGLFFMYTGTLFLKFENMPMNSAGLVPDTPEAQAAVRVTLGKGFMISGLLAAALGLLPGTWSMAALAPFVFGPLVAIVAAIGRAASKK